MPSKHSFWVSGAAGRPQRGIGPSKTQVFSAHKQYLERDGNIVQLAQWTGLAIDPLGDRTQFVIFHTGNQDIPESGECWIQYPIPVPSLVGNNIRAKFEKVLVRYRTPDWQKLAITEIDVWDQDKRVYQSGYLGSVAPNTISIVPQPPNDSIPGNRDVIWSPTVSIKIRANNCQNIALDMYGVGIEVLI